MKWSRFNMKKFINLMNTTVMNILDPSDRCGSCMSDPETDPISSAQLTCAQSSTDTMFNVSLWSNTGDCSGNVTDNIQAIGHSSDPTIPASAYCMSGIVSISGSDIPIFLIVDCGNNAPQPSSDPQCSLSTDQKLIIIGASIGAGVLLILVVASCCYCCQKRRAAQQAQLAHSNPGLARGILVEQPPTPYNINQPAYIVYPNQGQSQYIRM